MKWISFLYSFWVANIAGIIFCASLASADAPPSYDQPMPFAWAHQIPTGEQPGWGDTWWFNYSLSDSNIWNEPTTMTDKRNGDTYSSMADYEQTTLNLEVGHAFWDRLGVSIDLPIADRWGGVLDHFINAFHILGYGESLYNRADYPQWQTIYSVKKNNVDYFASQKPVQGLDNINLKFKLWMFKWMGDVPNSCPCGLSISSETKFPLNSGATGGTTGSIDQSVSVHLGIPLFSASAFWATASYTALGRNPAIDGWPQFNHIVMYEGNFDFALNDYWGFVISARAESPYLDRSALSFVDNSTNPAVVANDQQSSGWNALTHWLGSESFGFRYRTIAGSEFRAMFVEDFGLGYNDQSSGLYTINAPDVNIVIQGNFTF